MQKILAKAFVVSSVFTLTVLVCSCVPKTGKVMENLPLNDSLTIDDYKAALIGKWYRISRENGYAELEIDSQYVTVFSEKIGKSKLEYIVEGDSFKYLTLNYHAKIMPSGDTMVILIGKENTANLLRYDETFAPFESVPEQSDSVKLQLYMDSFYKRADNMLRKYGIIRNEM